MVSDIKVYMVIDRAMDMEDTVMVMDMDTDTAVAMVMDTMMKNIVRKNANNNWH